MACQFLEIMYNITKIVIIKKITSEEEKYYAY